MMSKKIKVVWTSLIPSPYRVDFFNELGKMCDLTVIFLKKSDKNREELWHKNNFVSFRGLFYNSNSGKEKLSFGFLKRIICCKSVDVRIISNIDEPTNVLLMIHMINKKINYYIEADGGFPKNKRNLKEFIKKLLIKNATGCFSSGIKCDDYFMHYGADKNRIFRYHFSSIFGNDIISSPISKNEKTAIRKEIGIKGNKKILLTVGQFIHRKGFDLLLKMAKKLSDNNIDVYIVGGKPTKDYLDYVSLNRIKNVFFLDFMPKDQLSKYYLASDVFVLPTREDIWGLVLNEAAAKGLPLIASDKCGAAFELIKNNGLILNFENYKNAVNLIVNIFNKDMIELSKNSILIAKQSTIEVMANEHIHYFKEIVSNE